MIFESNFSRLRCESKGSNKKNTHLLPVMPNFSVDFDCTFIKVLKIKIDQII